jgi:elongation factor G
MEAYLGEEEIDVDRLRAAIARDARHLVTPVLCGSSFRTRAGSRLLDAVVDFCRARSTSRGRGLEIVKGDEDRPANRLADDDQPFSALAFK